MWEMVVLSDVCQIDKTKKTSTNIPYVGMEHIESGTGVFLGTLDPSDVKSTTFEFTDNHLLYGRLRPYLNKVLIPNFSGHCSSEVFPILPSDKLDRKYLFYWFNQPSTIDAIDRTSTGARMPRANMKEVIIVLRIRNKTL